MKSSILATLVLVLSSVAFAHEDGHQAPAAYAGATISIGKGSFGVTAGQTEDGNLQVALVDLENESPIDPAKSEFGKEAIADVVLKGGKKLNGTKLALSGKAYVGKLSAKGQVDRVMKVELTHAKSGKVSTNKAIEEVGKLHSHGDGHHSH